MNKIYLAAGFSHKDEIAQKAGVLTKYFDKIVTSTWPWEKAAPASQLNDASDAYLREHAERDLKEIDACDTLILFTQSPLIPFVRGGRMYEAGYAYASGKRLIVCGPRENIFHYVEDVEVYETWEELLIQIGRENQSDGR